MKTYIYRIEGNGTFVYMTSIRANTFAEAYEITKSWLTAHQSRSAEKLDIVALSEENAIDKLYS